jgi:hypothetical protein
MIFINAIHISKNANMKYTTFETSIQIFLKYTSKPKRVPLSQLGSRKSVIKYVKTQTMALNQIRAVLIVAASSGQSVCTFTSNGSAKLI